MYLLISVTHDSNVLLMVCDAEFDQPLKSLLFLLIFFFIVSLIPFFRVIFNRMWQEMTELANCLMKFLTQLFQNWQYEMLLEQVCYRLGRGTLIHCCLIFFLTDVIFKTSENKKLYNHWIKHCCCEVCEDVFIKSVNHFLSSYRHWGINIIASVFCF